MKKKRKTQKKWGELSRRWENSFLLLHRSKYYIFVMFLVLFFASLSGFLFPSLFEEQVIVLIQQIFEEIGDKRGIDLIVHIFLNNTQASFFAMIIGAFFGVFPVVAALVNGYVIGFTAQYVSSQEGLFVLWRLLPHGIFEIPAIIISMGLGLYLGSRFLEETFHLKHTLHRLSILFVISFFSILFLGAYLFLGQGMILDSSADASSFSNGEIFTILLLALINILLIATFIFIIILFIRNKELKKDLVDSLWLFVLIIVPLLVIAGIVEGLLITFLS